MIKILAEKMGLSTIISHQLHGATLDGGKHDYAQQVIDGGYKRVVIIEMPGERAEAQLREAGVEVKIIDHHHYTGLDRAHGSDGEMLMSSLEQFLQLFKITDEQLKSWKLRPKLVHGVGIQDRGYIWALLENGYSKKEAMAVMDYTDELTAHLRNPKTEARKLERARACWEKRKKWREFYVVITRSNLQLRPRLSRIVAMELGKPTSLIIVEQGRGLIYVQESPYALELFHRFGGFTFGVDRNWGHKNEDEGNNVTLGDVKAFIESVHPKVVS